MPLLQSLQRRTFDRVFHQLRSCALIQSFPESRRGIVDSGAGFGYSGLLARCCAWGLCECTRTGWLMPLMGVGWSRPRAAGCVGMVTNPAEPEPLKGACTRDSHPNIFVWMWVETRALARFARGKSALRDGFLWGRLGFVVSHPFAKSANGWGTEDLRRMEEGKSQVLGRFLF